MKFYSEPNMTVFTKKRIGFRTKQVKVCQFYENGQFETDDEQLIEKLKPHFKHENNSEIQCKYCGGSHENKGQFMACARKNKKEE